MIRKSLKYAFIFLFLLIFSACSASTGSRYENKGKSSDNEKEKTEKPAEDFDMSNYRTKIDLPEKNKQEEQPKDLSIWYEYSDSDTTNSNQTPTVIDKVPGYRVQVYSTDKLDDANDKRSEVYFKTNQKHVYVIFDPPFYKVEVGDFTNISDAKDLSFKLKQLGYSDSRVINETVNIFEK